MTECKIEPRYVNQGELSGKRMIVKLRHAKSAGQKSERPYERGSGVMPVEQRGAGRWIR